MISVIVPVYNTELYLEECIKSLLEQTFTNFEIILIDDGSTDNSAQLCDKWAAYDNRIKVLHQKNSGVSVARKNGLEISSGQYISFVDSDDRLDKCFLEIMIEELVHTNSDIVCCNSVGAAEKDYGISQNNEYFDKPEELIQAYYRNMQYAHVIWGKLFKRKLFDEIEFPHMKYGEDTWVIMTIFFRKPRVSLLRYEGYFYRDNPAGAMRVSKGIQQPYDVLKCASYIYDNIQQNYPELLQMSKNKICDSIFNVLINSTNEKDKYLKQMALDEIDKNIYLINRKTGMRTVKSCIVLIYKFLPRIVLFAIGLYKKVKIYLKDKTRFEIHLDLTFRR